MALTLLILIRIMVQKKMTMHFVIKEINKTANTNQQEKTINRQEINKNQRNKSKSNKKKQINM